MRQADASDVSESIPVITSPSAPPTTRAKCRKPTAPLRMTRTIRIVSQTSQSSELWIRKAGAPYVSESIPVITSHAAPYSPS
eukprot:7156703-Pyramimonas_sp.AAC.1